MLLGDEIFSNVSVVSNRKVVFRKRKVENGESPSAVRKHQENAKMMGEKERESGSRGGEGRGHEAREGRKEGIVLMKCDQCGGKTGKGSVDGRLF